MEKSKKIKEKINNMQNSISYWQHFLLQETEEKELSPKQKKIAKLDPPADKIDAGDFAKLRAGAKVEEGQQEDWSQIYDQGYAEGYELGWKDGSSGKENSNPKAASKFKYGQDQFSEGEDHEVSMANNSLETIIKHAMDLKSKLGSEEKDIPAWIQDHITNAANFISQAAENYHEYGEDHDAAAGGEEKTDDEIETASLEDLTEIEFISLEDFAKNVKMYKSGDILKSQLINAFNRLESEDQQKAKQMVKDLNVLPAPRTVKETDTDSMSLESMMEKLLGIDKDGYTQNAQAAGPFRGASREMQMSGNLESKKHK